jgi:hypothetical protein
MKTCLKISFFCALGFHVATAVSAVITGAATNTGHQSAASVGGKESFAIATGIDGKAKGALGCYIACAEWSQDDNYNWHLKNFKTAKVDGKKIKPDTFYMLKNGKFVEVSDDK